MATKTISLSGINRSWSSSRPTTDPYNSYLPGATQIPLFSTINFITPSYSHSATKTTGDTLNYSRGIYYYSNAELGTERKGIPMTSGSKITDSTILGNGTLHAGNNVSHLYFLAYISDTSFLWNAKLKTHVVSSCKLTIDYTPFDYTIQLATRKEENDSYDIFYPAYDDRLFTGKNNGDGTATITINTSIEKYTGYTFDHWEDGSTETTRTIPLTDDATFVAIYRPIKYTVNYYDTTSGEDILINSQECDGDTTYNTPDLPIYNGEIPKGYRVNPTGWVNSKSGNIRNNSTEMYIENSTSTIMTQYNSFSNLTSVEGDIVNLYFGFYPIQYLINYRRYYKNSTSNYYTSTVYRIYNNGDYNLATLPNVNTGYKLTNKMLIDGGPIDSTITNSWFVSETNLTPGSEKITKISSTTANDVTVYSFETPIDFTVNFHTCDYNGDEINLTTIPCRYNITQAAPAKPEDRDGQVVYGWYSTQQDISTWYIQVNTNTLVNGTTSVGISFGQSNISHATTQDQAELHYYGYYIPRQYSLTYKWLDNWSPNSTEYVLPAAAIRIYGRDQLAVELIPNYEDYNIDNVNTINWYYYKNDDQTTERLINNWDMIPRNEFENKVFYALKTPKDRTITFSSNNDTLGVVIVTNQSDNNIYQEGDLIHCYIAPTEIGYFSHWSDGNRLPIRTITVGSKDAEYIAYFNDDKCLGILDAYAGISPLKSIFLGTLMRFKEIQDPSPTYTVSDISTTYKFTLNEDTGYYVSGNKGKPSSYSLCQVNINIPYNNYIMYVDCINSGESDYDFGILSNLNQSLVNSYTADTSTTLVKKSFKGLSSTSVQTVSYDLSVLSAGNHFIQIKYRKDSSGNSGNDSLQFKIRFEKKEEN